MKRRFRLVDPKFAWIYGAIGAIGVIVGACQGDFEAATCPADSCAGFGVDGGPTVGSGGSDGKGGAGGQEESHGPGGGGAGGGGPEPTLPDGGDPFTAPRDFPGCAGIDDRSPRIVYMSADDSNSMASPGHVRELINIGFEPSPSKIRTYEFLNYYRIAYDAPAYNELSIIPEMERTEEATIADFQIGLRSYDVLPANRRPVNFTFLVDTSGSMKGPGLTRAKAAVEAISSRFVQGDIINFLTTSTTVANLDGHEATGPMDSMLADVLAGLTAGGNSDLNASLAQAYKIAKKYKDRDINMMSRVILISDGGANVGITDTDLISEHSADADKEGIYLVGVGIGPALSYNDSLMNKVTDAGRGAYVYLDSVDEAQKLLADRFDETMDIAARGVQIELSLPWYFIVEGKSIDGHVSSTPVEPQHLAPNDAMVFFLQTTACDPAVYDQNDDVRIRVSWKEPITYLSRVTEHVVPLKSFIGKDVPRITKGRAIVAFAEALKACGFDSKGNFLCENETERKDVTKMKLQEARKLAEKVPADPEINEIIELIDKHPLMQ